MYAQAANAGVAPIGLVEPPTGFSDIRYVAGIAGREFRISDGPGFGSAADAPKQRARRARAGHGRRRRGASAAGRLARRAAPRGGGAGLNVQGLPLVKPPYGLLVGDQSRSRRAGVAGAARRHAGRRAQSPGAQGADHSEDRPAAAASAWS